MASVKDIITEDPTGVQLDKYAHDNGKLWAGQSLTRAQIRNLFAEARSIEASWRHSPDASFRRLVLLKPKLAYQARRQSAVEPLAKALAEGIDAVIAAGDNSPLRAERFRRWMQLFEAILAYHRASGGN